VRDPQAIAVVQSAINAMGGTGAIASIESSIVAGSSVNNAAASNGTQSFVWTYAGSEFRNENDAQTGSHILVSNGGVPEDLQNGSWLAAPVAIMQTNLPYHIPALVLLDEINNGNYSFGSLGTMTVDGINALHVPSRDNSDATTLAYTTQDWYFDPTTQLPVRVEYQIPVDQNPQHSLQASIDFSIFRVVSGIAVPFQLNITEGPASCTSTISSVAFNVNVNPSEFAPSTGGAQ
jgi:hypothetical protein